MIFTSQIASIFTLTLGFTFCISCGEAVICYECNSRFDPRCGDPFDPYGLGIVNCSLQPRLEHMSSLEPTVCRKISQKDVLESRNLIFNHLISVGARLLHHQITNCRLSGRMKSFVISLVER
ncbi:uncharacterized protein LOC107043372 [Diachasma alloeum]|uniref:uncharacterized protein LOC107043372 n=1 Tax=Diachasma alloeum TaxID=454923 RepID=UPI0010FAD4A6|nr:uncharacterized protein LOC107043372 [Diachasma alloeum]